MHTESFKNAGQTRMLRTDKEIIHNFFGDCAGQEVIIEDWWDKITGGSWMYAEGNPAALVYAIRGALVGLPTDDEEVYVKINGLGMLIHVSEFAS